MSNIISLREAARRCKVRPSVIEYHIKKGTVTLYSKMEPVRGIRAIDIPILRNVLAANQKKRDARVKPE